MIQHLMGTGRRIRLRIKALPDIGLFRQLVVGESQNQTPGLPKGNVDSGLVVERVRQGGPRVMAAILHLMIEDRPVEFVRSL